MKINSKTKNGIIFLSLLVVISRLTSTDGQEDTTAADDETTPADDETTPADDETTPADDETTPADDETTPADGETPPADDETTPEGDKNHCGVFDLVCDVNEYCLLGNKKKDSASLRKGLCRPYRVRGMECDDFHYRCEPGLKCTEESRDVNRVNKLCVDPDDEMESESNISGETPDGDDLTPDEEESTTDGDDSTTGDDSGEESSAGEEETTPAEARWR